jgi:D-alanine transaminase/branched-chain amino acid aminotransferase
MLKGVTRKQVLDLSAGNYLTEARDISFEEFRNAKEVFITSTTKNILPVVQVDGHVIGDGSPGEVSRALANEYNKSIYGS